MKKCPFTGHRSAMLEIRDEICFLLVSNLNWHRQATKSFIRNRDPRALKAEKQAGSIRFDCCWIDVTVNCRIWAPIQPWFLSHIESRGTSRRFLQGSRSICQIRLDMWQKPPTITSTDDRFSVIFYRELIASATPISRDIDVGIKTERDTDTLTSSIIPNHGAGFSN